MNKKVRQSFGDASGELIEIMKAQKKGQTITREMVKEADIWMGGFTKINEKEQRAWSLKITEIPEWVSRYGYLHIGIFEGLTMMIEPRVQEI